MSPIDDLKANTEYHKYQANSLQIIWFWRALRSFDQTDKAKFMQFVTGSSKVIFFSFLYVTTSDPELGISIDSKSADKELKAVTPEKSKTRVTTFTKKLVTIFQLSRTRLGHFFLK